MTELLVGIDVGTTRVKALAVSLDGAVVGEAEETTPWRHDGACADIDADVLAGVAMAVADRCLDDQRVPTSAIVRGVGVTGMAEAGALLDAAGNPCAPTLVWHDPRGLAEPIRSRVPRAEFWRACGIRLNSKPSLAKILYLYDAFPGTRERAHRHLGIGDWVVHAMGGEQVAERSILSRTGLYDVLADEPWDVATELVGDLTAPRRIWAGESAGTVGGAAPQRLRGATLTAAGLDHESAAFAMGAMRLGVLTDSLGTAEALLRVFAPVDRDTVERLVDRDVGVGWGVVPGYLCIVAGLLTGLSLERMAALLGITERAARRAVSEEALTVDRSGVPFRIAEASHEGLGLAGVTEGLSPALAWRAAVEDLTAMSTDLIDFIESVIGTRTEAMVTGGWSHDPTVAAAKRRQLGDYTTSAINEAAAMGAAFFAGIAAGLLERPGADESPRWAT
ncbi:MAG: FGGY family carbohydrate kinase [Candidatus Nanopelagicales bacterium]|jgi:sugar (pentulose or hexulose) kinase